MDGGNGTVEKAIEATEPGAAAPAVVTIRLNLSTGRPVAMLVPLDLSVQENLDLAAFVTTGLGKELVRQREPKSKLVAVRGRLSRR